MTAKRQGNYNHQHTKSDLPATSQFKGVTLISQDDNPRWRSQIMVRGRRVHLGSFSSVYDHRRGIDWGEVAAAFAYDLYALEIYGNQANLNFPQMGENTGIFVRAR